MTTILKKIPLAHLKVVSVAAVITVVILAAMVFYRYQLSLYLKSQDSNAPYKQSLQSVLQTQKAYYTYEKLLLNQSNATYPLHQKRLEHAQEKLRQAIDILKEHYPKQARSLIAKINKLNQEGMAAHAERPLDYKEIGVATNAIASLLLKLEQENMQHYYAGLTDLSSVESNFLRGLDIIIVLLVVSIGSVAFMTYFLVSQPFKKLLPVLKSMLEGEEKLPLPFNYKSGLLGGYTECARAFQDHLEQINEMHANEVMMNQYSDEREMHTHAIVNEFEIKVKKLVNTFKSAAILLQNATHNMNITVEKTSHESSEAKRSAKETTQNVESASSATQNLSNSFQEVSKRIHASSAVIESAVKKSKHADDIVKTLSGSAQTIGKVLTYITKIASQINMLSLNATIESERAGEAGRGFAVVAHEVKGLAVQTSEATEDIDRQVKEIRVVTENVVEVIDQMKAAISEISVLFSTISEAVQDQDHTTQALFDNMRSTSEHIQVLSESIAHSADTSTHAEQAAKTVTQAADIIKNSSKELGDDITMFLQQIKEL